MYEKLETMRVNTFDVKNQLPRWVDDAARRAARRGEEERAAISNGDELNKRQQYIRDSLARSLGDLPETTGPLNPRITGTVNAEGFRIEKIIFESRPSVYVTGNLYIPDGAAAGRGAVLFLCGHREQAKHCDEYQTVCQYLVQAGLVVFAIDPIGQGERYGFYDPVSKQAAVTSVQEHERVGRQCLPVGDSLARYMLHDAMRAIDYLCTRTEVDERRIGVTGHSGGGTQTSLLMMADPRIAAAAPGGFIMNRPYFRMTGKTQDSEQKWPGFSAMGLDHEDILLAMAPRPVLVLATTYDSVPIEAARHTVEVNRRFWAMSGRTSDLGIYEDKDVHRFTVPLAQAAAAFFSKHLLGSSVIPSEQQISLMAPERLWCTSSGQVIGELEGARNVHTENIERLAMFEEARNTIPGEDMRARSLEWLRESVFRNRDLHDLNPRHYNAGELGDMRITRTLWWSQSGLLNAGYQFQDKRLADRKLPVSIAVWDGGVQCLKPHAEWIEAVCGSGRLVLVLNMTAVGPLLPHLDDPQDNPFKHFGVLDKHTDELIWLGDSMAAMRTYDVLRAVELAAKLDGTDAADIRLYGFGRYAVYAGWAALLDSRIRAVRMDNRIPSLADWVKQTDYEPIDTLSFILPGMLRYFDLTDMDRWLKAEGRLEQNYNSKG